MLDDSQDTDDTDDADDNVDGKAGRVTGRVALPTRPASKLFMFVKRMATRYTILFNRF